MSIANNLFWSYFERWANQIISLIVFIIIARYLSPQEMAVITFAKLFIDYLDVLAGQGVGFQIIQNKNLKPVDLDTAFWSTVIVGLLLNILIYFLAPLIKQFNPQYASLETIIRLLSIIITINAFSRVQVAILMKNQEFKKLSIRSVIQVLIGGLIGVFFALSGHGAFSLVYQSLAGSIFAFIFLWGSSSWRPQFKYSFESAKNSFKYTSKIILDQNVLFLSKRLDEVIIGIFLPVTSLGYYGVAKRIFNTSESMFFSVIFKVVLPAYSKNTDKRESILLLNEMITLLGTILFPIFILVAILSAPLLTILFGAKWLAASTPLSILMLSGIFLLIPYLLHPIYLAHGDSSTPLKLNFIRASIVSILTPIASVFGLNGITSVTFIRNIFASWIDMKSLDSVDKSIMANCVKVFAKTLVMSIPMTICTFTLYLFIKDHVNDFFTVIASTLISLIVYTLTIFIFDKKTFNTFFKKLNFKF